MIPRKNPESQADDLKTLLHHATGYARHMMETTGSVPPTLMADTPEGVILFVPKSMADDDAKDKFANAGRLLAVGHKATAVAMVLESWATFANRPGQPVANVPPSQSPDREEVVVVMAEAHCARAQQFLFIQRDGQGKFTGFGTSLLPQFDQMEGRFARMMPGKKPTENEAQMARTLLKTMGMAVQTPGNNTLWN